MGIDFLTEDGFDGLVVEDYLGLEDQFIGLAAGAEVEF